MPSTSAGFILFPLGDAETLLARCADFVSTGPEELAVMSAIVSGPDGPVTMLAPVWSGAPEQGEHVLAGLRELGTPIVFQVAPMGYGDMMALYDPFIVSGRRAVLETRWLARESPDAYPVLAGAGAARTSPYSGVVLHHLRGAATRVDVCDTAFGLRQEHFMVEFVAIWDGAGAEDASPDNGRHRGWARGSSRALERFALPGGYPNILAPNAYNQVKFAYGPNATRLLRVKQKYDPAGTFAAIPLPA